MIAEKNCFRKENDFRKQLPVDLKLGMEKRLFKMTREGMPPAQRTERLAACWLRAAFFPIQDSIQHRRSVWIRSGKDTRSLSQSNHYRAGYYSMYLLFNFKNGKVSNWVIGIYAGE